MSKKHLAYLLATTLLAAPALAQTSGSSGSSSTSPSPPGATDMQRNSGAGGSQDRATTSQSMTRQSGGSTADIHKALPAPGPNQMMASDIRGTRVYGANNENVGDISDILLSRDGDIVALVVGVGGFLGIGQKDVAIPFQAFEFVTESPATASRSSTSTSTGAVSSTAPRASSTASSSPSSSSSSSSSPSSSQSASGAGSSMSGVSGTTGSNSANADNSRSGSMSSSGPATTGSTPGATATTSTTTSQQSAGVLKPERIVLRGMTKADLEAAPEFKKTAANTRSGNSSTNR